MSRDIYFGIEYLQSDENDKTKLHWECLKTDIGDIIPLVLRDRAEDIFKINPKPAPGAWFKQTGTVYYFLASELSELSEKMVTLAKNIKNEDEDGFFESEFNELLHASKFFIGLDLLVDYFLDEEEIYSIDKEFIRFIGYIE
jgi:hypothetical protein